MATVKTKISEIKSGGCYLYEVDGGEYELTSETCFGFLKISLSNVDDMIDVLTTFKKEMSK